MPPSSEWRFSLINWSRVALVRSSEAMVLLAFSSIPLPCSLSRPLALRINSLAWARAALACLLAWANCCITALTFSRSAESAPVAWSRWSRVRLMRAVFSSESRLLKRAMSWLMLPIRSSPLLSNWVSGEGVATITGIFPSLPSSIGLAGVPLLSWMIEVPVIPVSASLAVVSCLIGARATTRMRAQTLRGSFGSRRRKATSPTLIPLYCTELPWERPLTASLKTMS